MPELVGFVCKLATKYRALLRKLIYKEKAPCGSSQPYTSKIDTCFILSGEYSTTKNKKKRKENKEEETKSLCVHKKEREREKEKEKGRKRERDREREGEMKRGGARVGGVP